MCTSFDATLDLPDALFRHIGYMHGTGNRLRQKRTRQAGVGKLCTSEVGQEWRGESFRASKPVEHMFRRFALL